MALKIQLFGELRVWREGEEKPVEKQEWLDRKSIQLFVILVSEPGRVFHKDELMEWLWPRSDPTQAQTSLRNRISRLRRLLEPKLAKGIRSHYIKTCPGGYCFEPEAEYEIDILSFEASYREGRASEQAEQWHEAIAHYTRAAALYKGDYLSEERYEAWVLARQEHWKRIYLEVLVHLAECWARVGLYREAVEHGEQAIEIAPTWSETMYRQLISYYAHLGDRAGMMRTYARLEQMLAEYFHAEPSPQTKELIEKIVDTCSISRRLRAGCARRSIPSRR